MGPGSQICVSCIAIAVVSLVIVALVVALVILLRKKQYDKSPEYSLHKASLLLNSE